MVPENVAIPLQLRVGTRPCMFGDVKRRQPSCVTSTRRRPTRRRRLSDLPPNPDAEAAGQPKDAAGKDAGCGVPAARRRLPHDPVVQARLLELQRARQARRPRRRQVLGEDPDRRRLRRHEGRPGLHDRADQAARRRFDQEVDEGGAKKKVPTFIGVGVEMSAAEGFKALPAGFRLNKSIPLGPALSLDQLTASSTRPRTSSAAASCCACPATRRSARKVQLKDGKIQKLGADIALPAPVPLFGPVAATSIGGHVHRRRRDPSTRTRAA